MILLMPALIMAAAPTDGMASDPVPVHRGTLMSIEDYPETALRHNEQGTVWADLSIDATGKPAYCEVISSSGSTALDNKTCSILLKRARFSPARDGAGQPIASLYRNRMDWRLNPQGDVAGLNPVFDRTFTVNRFPAGARPPVSVVMRQVIDAYGHLESCAVVQGSGFASIDKLACSSTAGLTSTSGIRDPNGTPVRGLRLRRVAFDLAESPARN